MFFREKGDERTKSYPLLPLREVVVFPHTPMSLIVGRPLSVAAVGAANKHKGEIFLAAQRSGERIDPSAEDIYTFGTVATIEQTLYLPDGNT